MSYKVNKAKPALAAAILAGGLATRLKPITEKIPKSLVEVAGRPFIEHQLELLRANAVTDIVICAGHLGEMIERHVGDGSRWKVRVRYSYDGPKLLGTGGALQKALQLLSDPFFSLYGDSYLPVDYQKVADAFFQSGKAALMTVYENQNQWDTSNAQFENGTLKRYSKTHRDPAMRHIDYGLSVFAKRAFEKETAQPLDMADLFAHLLAAKDLAAYEIFERFYEIGSPAGLAELKQILK